MRVWERRSNQHTSGSGGTKNDQVTQFTEGRMGKGLEKGERGPMLRGADVEALQDRVLSACLQAAAEDCQLDSERITAASHLHSLEDAAGDDNGVHHNGQARLRVK